MKFFRLLQKSCQIMDILPSGQSTKSSFNLITLLILLPTILFSISSMAFLLYKPQSIQEHRDSFFATTSSFVCLANFSVVIGKMPNFLQMIQKFDDFVQKGERKNDKTRSTKEKIWIPHPFSISYNFSRKFWNSEFWKCSQKSW